MRNSKAILTLPVIIMLLSLSCQTKKTINIVIPENSGEAQQFAATELVQYLGKIYPRYTFNLTNEKSLQASIQLAIEPDTSKLKGAYTISNNEQSATITANSSIGLLYGVYGMLEHLGCGFFMSKETLPEPKDNFDFGIWELQNEPLVNERIIFNWHNFISGCSGWSLDEWKSWVLQSVKMGYNSIMVHAYGNNPMGNFDFNGIEKNYGYLTTTSKGRDWGAQHVNDIRRLQGGEIFKNHSFGSESAFVADEERTTAAREMMSKVFAYARSLGMGIIYAMDIDTYESNPQEIVKTLPEEARLATKSGNFLADPETEEGYAYYKEQVKDLLDLYPEISHLAFWKRGLWLKTVVKEFDYESFPIKWKNEYDKLLSKHPELKDDKYARPGFVQSKIITAMGKAAQKLNPNIELSCGSWAFDYVNSANIMLPENIGLLPLDFKHHFTKKYATELFVEVSKKRKVVPIIWAHHDDHRYMGKPYTPYQNFYTELQKCRAEGFAIIHWKTSPLDLFFTSHIRQVWKNTNNENINSAINFYNQRIFGSNQESLHSYMHKWVTEAPMFGRETGDHLFDNSKFILGEKKGTPKKFLNGIEERLKILEDANKDSLSNFGKSMYEFHKNKELFYKNIIETQEKITESQKLIKANEFDSARIIVETIESDPTMESYSKFINSAQITKGEQASLISLNLRWVPDIIELRQQVGLEKIRINFQPTSYDPLASAPGRYTYFIDNNGNYWYGLGEKELGKAKVLSNENILHEIEDSYILVSEELSIPLKIRRFNLPAGKYELWIHSDSKNNDLFESYINNGSEKSLHYIQSEKGIYTGSFETKGSATKLVIQPKELVKIFALELKKL